MPTGHLFQLRLMHFFDARAFRDARALVAEKAGAESVRARAQYLSRACMKLVRSWSGRARKMQNACCMDSIVLLPFFH